MMKKYLYFSLFICLASCSPQKKEVQETVQTEEISNEVRTLPEYAYTDSLMQGSHKVVYAISSGADDELPLVVDEDGVKYKDNRYQLTITKDDKALFSRSFTKADFKSQLPGDFQKYGIMDGLRFNRTEEGKLIFNTCVSYPESDMSCPFFLTIGPDGSYTLTLDTTIDEDNLPPTPEQIPE